MVPEYGVGPIYNNRWFRVNHRNLDSDGRGGYKYNNGYYYNSDGNIVSYDEVHNNYIMPNSNIIYSGPDGQKGVSDQNRFIEYLSSGFSIYLSHLYGRDYLLASIGSPGLYSTQGRGYKATNMTASVFPVVSSSVITASGVWVSNSTLDGINTATELGGWFSNIWGDAARYSLEGMSKTDVARPLVRGIGIGAKTIGYTGMVVSLGIDMYKYNQNPTWGNAGRVGVDAAAIGISYAWPGPGTALGIGAAALNATGGLNGFYSFLDANQALYNSTGYIMVPGLNPLNHLTIIKIK